MGHPQRYGGTASHLTRRKGGKQGRDGWGVDGENPNNLASENTLVQADEGS